MAKWVKGQSGNPAGRPKGSRDALSEAVYKQIAADWGKHGAEVIKAVRENKPEAYLQVVARLMPAAHEVTVEEPRSRSVSEFSDEELVALIGDDELTSDNGLDADKPA